MLAFQISQTRNLFTSLLVQVKQSIYKQLKANRLSTKRLFIVSAWNLQEFVSVLSNQEMEQSLRLIDEQRFLRRLIEGVLVKRKYREKLKKKSQKERQQE